jgi:hypothetical protein
MSASISSLTAILKDFYLGPIAEQLNQEILVYELFEKATVDWSGKQVVIPVHVARNSGVDAAADDGTLPTAGSQDFEHSGRTDLNVGNATDLVDIVRLDTYATVVANVQVDAVTSSTITFSAAQNLAVAGAETDIVFALVATTASTIIDGVAGQWNNEPAGITTNLAAPSHEG